MIVLLKRSYLLKSGYLKQKTNPNVQAIITWAERQVEDSRLGCPKVAFLGDNIGHAQSVSFRFDSAI